MKKPEIKPLSDITLEAIQTYIKIVKLEVQRKTLTDLLQTQTEQIPHTEIEEYYRQIGEIR